MIHTIKDSYPLSPMQEGMLYHSLYHPQGGFDVIVEWNARKINFPQDQCVHELFATWAKKSPNTKAIVQRRKSQYSFPLLPQTIYTDN